VLGYLAAGKSEDEVLRDFPYLTRDETAPAWHSAADRERRIALTAIAEAGCGD
jgi:uncharacterized protein (DUF433 family)